MIFLFALLMEKTCVVTDTDIKAWLSITWLWF